MNEPEETPMTTTFERCKLCGTSTLSGRTIMHNSACPDHPTVLALSSIVEELAKIEHKLTMIGLS